MKTYGFVIITAMAAGLMGCKKGEQNKLGWRLPNGEVLEFYHAPSGFTQSDHAKCIDLIEANGKTSHFEFGQSHSGYSQVELRISDDDRVVWIIDLRQRQIGGSLDLVSREFRGEGEKHPAKVSITGGRVLMPKSD